MLEWQVNDLRQTLGKSMPAQICEPGILVRKGHWQLFSRRKSNARESASSRDPDWEEDETLVAGCPLSSDRSRLPHMEGEEKLPAPLRPVSANCAEAWAERVLGILAALNHPAVSWVATSTFWGNFPAAAGSTSPLKGVLSGKVLITTVISMAFAPWCGYSALPARSAT
jgi:hypothetical protein